MAEPARSDRVDPGSSPGGATEGEPGRAWASLLTSARFGVRFDFSALRFREMNHQVVVPVWKAGGGCETLRFEFSIFRSVESEPVR
jgi:hypothetical protein